MNEMDHVVEISRTALFMTLKLSIPLLAVGLLVGLLVSLFQAVTQIQEQTLAFVPKLLVVLLTLVFFLPTLLGWTVEYTRETIGSLHQLWGG